MERPCILALCCLINSTWPSHAEMICIVYVLHFLLARKVHIEIR